MSTRATVYVIAIIAIGLGIWVSAFVGTTYDVFTWIGLAVFLALTTTAQLFMARAPSHVNYYVTPVFTFASVILFDPFMFGIVIIVSSIIEQVYLRWQGSDQLRDWYLQPFNIASDIIAGTAARLVYNTALSVPWGQSQLQLMISGLVAALAFVFLNHTLLGVALVLGRGKRWGETGMLQRETLFNDWMLLLLGFVVAKLWHYNPWLVVPALSPLVPMYRALLVPRLEQEAATDVKTGLSNARYFNKRFGEELERSARLDRPMALLMCDLDYLRKINNTHGHLAGDVVLAGIAQTIKSTIRPYDFASRFGGEEFAIVLPETALEAARGVAEKVRAAVEAQQFLVGTSATPIRATMSIGVAVFPADATASEALFHQADIAVYHAKSSGRNQVVCADDLTWEVRSQGIPLQQTAA